MFVQFENVRILEDLETIQNKKIYFSNVVNLTANPTPPRPSRRDFFVLSVRLYLPTRQEKARDPKREPSVFSWLRAITIIF